ncbi:MAG TPA: DUF975 family protein [Acetivibrio sp.]|nr:DUF975 family protein [Acetivibrio sp.]
MEKSIGDIKRVARSHLSGTGLNCVIITFTFYVMVATFFEMGYPGKIIILLILAPLLLGTAIYSVYMVRSGNLADNEKSSILDIPIIGPFGMLYSTKILRSFKISLKPILFGFKYYFKAIALLLTIILRAALWSLLLIIPGIIKLISSSMCFYIMADKPDISIREAIRLSDKMMEGYKKKCVLLNLSLIGWVIFAFVTCLLGSVITIPYMLAPNAVFYIELKEENIQKGVITEDEIGITKIWEY